MMTAYQAFLLASEKMLRPSNFVCCTPKMNSGQAAPARATTAVCTWMNKNLTSAPRPFKSKQLWVHGKTNLGKSTMLLKLSYLMEVYCPPVNEVNFDGFVEGGARLIFFDEFHPSGHWTVPFLNKLVEGTPCTLKARYQSKRKVKNIPVIITSNDPPDVVYSNAAPLPFAALLARFEVVEAKKFIDIAYNGEDEYICSDEEVARAEGWLPEHDVPLGYVSE